jgi:radical SAM superfamily enzyme YgiQ (UPF0313 family)
MNVLLINPPYENLLAVGISPPVEKRGFYPGMGLLYVASFSCEKTSHTIHVLDAALEGIDFSVLEQRIRSHDPDVVGISAQTFTLVDSLKTARIVKKIDPNIIVVFGGIHVTLFPFETINLDAVDVAVTGEGEITFAALLDCISNRNRLRNVKGILYKKNGEVIQTENRPVLEDLDRLPFPARRMTPYQKFVSLRKDTITTTLITQRGCPYNCLFCSRPSLGRKVRLHSALYMIDEIKQCLDLGIREFMIYDDTFTLDRQRTLDFCKEIRKQGLDIDWTIMTRVDLVDRELLHVMKKAGCSRIRYGVESGANDILANLKKDITVQQINEAFQITKEEGIETVAYFMIGSPGETQRHFDESIRLAKKLNANYTNFSITTLYPKTGLLRLAMEKGLQKDDPWKRFVEDPRPGFKLPLWEEYFDRNALLRFQALAVKKLYLRPRYILVKLFKILTLKGFIESVRLGAWFARSLKQAGRKK